MALFDDLISELDKKLNLYGAILSKQDFPLAM